MTRYTLLTLIALVGLPVATTAQTIHGEGPLSMSSAVNPQKAVYTSPDDWPTISSQCHWKAPGIGGVPGVPAHTHNDLKFPLYAETTGSPFTVPFTITLFHTNGKIVSIGNSTTGVYAPAPPIWGDNPPNVIAGWTLDNGVKLPLVGDPMGVVVYTGKVTFDPMRATSKLVKHGWVPYVLQVSTKYDNGDTLTNEFMLPTYHTIDPTAPEATIGDGTGIRMRSKCIIGGPGTAGFNWGFHIVEFLHLLPILGPVSATLPWLQQGDTYNYGAPVIGTGTFELRVDPDLHHDIPGTIVDTMTAITTSTIDALPNVLPSTIDRSLNSTHKLMSKWCKPNPNDLSRELCGLLVWNQQFGPGGVVQPPLYTPFLKPASGSSSPPPPPPPPPGPCSGLVGQTTTVTLSGVPFKGTITSEDCKATVVYTP